MGGKGGIASGRWGARRRDRYVPYRHRTALPPRPAAPFGKGKATNTWGGGLCTSPAFCAAYPTILPTAVRSPPPVWEGGRWGRVASGGWGPKIWQRGPDPRLAGASRICRRFQKNFSQTIFVRCRPAIYEKQRKGCSLEK